MIRAFFAGLLCVAFTAVAFAPHPMTKLTVEVRAFDDKPVERASVIVTFVEDATT